MCFLLREIAAKLGIGENAPEPYGRTKAKLDIGARRLPRKGKLILVTAITPAPAGEGKTTTSGGCPTALNLLGKKVVLALREPSWGPSSA